MKSQLLSTPTPAHFDFETCLGFLDRGYDEVLYQIKDKTLKRLIQVNDVPVWLAISAGPDHLKIHVYAQSLDARILKGVQAYVRHWFDLDRDIEPFVLALQGDARISHLAEDCRGLHLIGIPDLFEAICWSIIGQQINLPFAYRLKRRLVEAYGRSLVMHGQRFHLFPEPKVLASVSTLELRDMQFSRQKIRYLKNLANRFAEGQLSMNHLRALPDHDARRACLLKELGIGIWTANYVMMKTLGDPSSIPYGDAGLIQALKRYEAYEKNDPRGSTDRFFGDYSGWESYLTVYLWYSLHTTDS